MPCSSIGRLPCLNTSQLRLTVTSAPCANSSTAKAVVGVSTWIVFPFIGPSEVTRRSGNPVPVIAMTRRTGPIKLTKAVM